jgi:diguanylate cyclase (GGDEF)-like protein
MTGQHDAGILFYSALIVVFGSWLTMSLFSRARRTRNISRILWSIVSGVVGGATVWSTHFVSMIAFDPGLKHAYNESLTTLSFSSAIITTTAGILIAAYGRRTVLVEIGGAVVGGGIALMHFIGMAGYRVEGTFEHDLLIDAVAVALGCFFACLAVNRVARSVSRYSRIGAAVSFLLSICLLHFLAMSALTITPDSSISVPDLAMTSEQLVNLVMSRIVFILALGLIAYALDHYKNQEILQRYRQLALHDPLTKLPNRAYLTERLEQLAMSSGNTRSVFLNFDLNRFKHVNDTFGHSMGDHVLVTVANRLRNIIQDGEFVARIGGDEFIALKEHVKSPSEALAFAQRVKQAVTEELEHDGKILSVGTSIGIVTMPDDGMSVDDLVGKADLAMYRAKRESQSGIAFYNAEKDEANRDRSAISIDMRLAIENNEFELYYQPQNRVSDRALIGFEVLLRWNHPERGVIGPEVFIPIAERDGYVNVIGEWVIRQACKEAASWKIPTRIAVNVAASQLRGHKLPDTIRNALKDTGLSPSLLEIELTESGIIADYNHALSIVTELKALGVSIAMDDFGTGYSSLSTLQAFPFDKIKIDKAFVMGINKDEKHEAIVRSAIKLGETLSITVLAEGVETEEQFRVLEREGCLFVQGYLFGRPTADVEGLKLADRINTANNVVKLRR